MATNSVAQTVSNLRSTWEGTVPCRSREQLVEAVRLATESDKTPPSEAQIEEIADALEPDFVRMPDVEIRVFSSMPELATEGWDPNACDAADYRTDRAARLYDALGVSRDDEEYALARHFKDGRWALIGLTVSGHRYAVEL